MTITIHKGANKIGGSITEISAGNSRIIIDFGADLPGSDKELTEIVNAEFEIDGVTRGELNCDAVILTHYHGDHVGLYEKILPEIPIYIGETAKKINLVLTKWLAKYHHVSQAALSRAENFQTYHANEPLTFGSIKVTPYYTDHSAFDAYMLLIEADGKRILHTGDFRTHGKSGPGVLKCLKYYVDKVDAVICEGTRIDWTEPPMTQREIENEADKLVRENKHTFVLCSSTNIDHIHAMYRASEKNYRMFICDDYQINVLMAANSGGKYSFKYLYTYNQNLDPHIAERGFCCLVRANGRDEECIEKYRETSLLIYSMWMGYINGPCHNNQTARFVESFPKWTYLHTSGHASRDAIKDVLETVKPNIVIPIHTEHSESFDGVCSAKTIHLNDGESYILKSNGKNY